jgi:predicted transposase YbfD/YdcC
VFAQVQTEAKSNEITAIPVLPEQIAIAGCIITIDAMGCQYEIADRIVKKGLIMYFR